MMMMKKKYIKYKQIVSLRYRVYFKQIKLHTYHPVRPVRLVRVTRVALAARGIRVRPCPPSRLGIPACPDHLGETAK